jgi:hypothetical protein
MHVVSDIAALAELYLPEAQFKQSLAFVAPSAMGWSMYLPTSQAVHRRSEGTPFLS